MSVKRTHFFAVLRLVHFPDRCPGDSSRFLRTASTPKSEFSLEKS